MGHVVHGDVKTSKDGLVKSDGDEGVGSCSVVLRCCSLWVSGWFRAPTPIIFILTIAFFIPLVISLNKGTFLIEFILLIAYHNI